VIKYGLVLLVLVSILLLGLSSPGAIFDPRRDPVPSFQKVAHSSNCAGCHGEDETGQALVDGEGNDVSIYNDWQISMMGLSAYDPFWRATLSHEVELYPAAKEAIESTCLRCHAPLGSFQAQLNGEPYSFELMLADSLGLDGVSCSSCHQQPSLNLGKGHSGNFTIDTNRLLFGPYPNPFQGPMQIYVGFDPVFADHIYSSGICAGCHTLITETLTDDGMPSGEYFVEQATYHEWLNSSYPGQGKECQSCHMPFIQDSVVIATDFLALKKRHPFGLHQFFGANTAMLDLMKANRDLLDLPSGPPEAAWNESIENNRLSLKRAAEITSSLVYVENDTLHVTLSIKNKTGHKLPSGYPSRLAWLEVVLKDNKTEEIYYANGVLDDEGNIPGRDLPFEPHHQVSKSSGDVQIYEMVMSDLLGHYTTRLNAANEPLKDNRLLPLGFRKTHAVYDTVAVWGSANEDPDYNSGSNNGMDQIEYRIPLGGRDGIADLSISLHYHAIPSRWMNDLFDPDTLALVNQFKTMYEGYQQFDEIIDELVIEDIDLSTTSTHPIQSISAFNIAPNPVGGNMLRINLLNPGIATGHLRYEIIDLNGMRIQEGIFSTEIPLNTQLKKGLYYFMLFDHLKPEGIKPFTVL
jgi:Cytochrome c554 and c-prime